jgi:hypothetical protein
MLPLETALFGSPPTDRDAKIVARHFGFDGRGGANFQRIGNEFGLTRERVRQIVTEADPRRQIMPSGISTLDRVIALIVANLPAPAVDIEKKLQATGLTAKPFRIEGVVNVAALVSRPLELRISSLKKTRFALPASWPLFRELVSGARQQVRRHGMAEITQFVNHGVTGERARRDASVIATILSAQPDFRWLDRKSGWFWLEDTQRNCAVSRIRKMLAVANPLPVSELRAGLDRMGSTLAPERTLLAFCRQIDGLSVCGEMIHADPGIETADVLNKTEQDIYQLLSENNGIMSNAELIWQSNVLGMKRPTFYQCVTYSPIVARYNGSSYRLIGSLGQSGQPMKSGTA